MSLKLDAERKLKLQGSDYKKVSFQTDQLAGLATKVTADPKPSPARHASTPLFPSTLRNIWASHAPKHGPSSDSCCSISRFGERIVKNHDITFSNRPKTTATDILLYECQDTIREVVTIALIERIGRASQSSNKDSSINLSENMLIAASNDILSRSALGRNNIADEGGRSQIGSLKLLIVPRIGLLFRRGQDFPFVPFGSGRRGCPGLAFGAASTEYVTANLLYWFDWKLPGDENEIKSAKDLDMTEVYGLTVHRKTPSILCTSRRVGNRWRLLVCQRFSGPKDEDLTIAGRLLGAVVTMGLGGMRFGEMEEGKGHGFDAIFRLSTLAVVVIFLPTAFLVLVDFHFVMSLIIMMVFPLSGLVVCSPDLDFGDLLVLLDLWLCKVFGDLCDMRSWLPIDRQSPLLVGALLSKASCMLVSGVSRYFPVFGP
ncbi:hypothetical protein TIFTF001_018759 [Ficus carica]|uniref:Cytochrome P450 n=1 Tax=Ficus carica TaxID=3494 RepID=A0AA88ANW0_FICCA|nr:hypothetical protein TIFTF001_018759 [Ficus carica]